MRHLPPRRTIRVRLTLLYSGMFLTSTTLALAVFYLLITGRVFSGPNVLDRHADGTDSGPANTSVTPTPANVHGSPQAHQLLLFAGSTLALTLVVSTALGWLMAGRVLRPLRTITAATRQISAHNLDQRLAVAGPDDELKDLADTIDSLLGRLDAAFDNTKEALDAQQRFVANASHEMRRPLTLERATLEIALHDPAATVESLRATCERILGTIRQQEGLIDALLTLARGQRGLDRCDPFDLAAITEEVVLARQAQAQRQGLHITTQSHPAPALGDPRLAERLLINLIDNALNHNQPDGWVDITIGPKDGHAVLSVSNSGPDVPPSEIDRLMRPFQRLGADRTNHREGHGLGLSIVAAIAAAHHAELKVRARPTGGLDVAVHFPEPGDRPGRPAASSVGPPARKRPGKATGGHD
jgi:signal transduction histidine kinase